MNKDTSTTYTIPEAAPELDRGPAWLKEKRKNSREGFNSSPLPRRGLHLWRYTDPAKFLVEEGATIDTSFENGYDELVQVEMKNLEDGEISGLVIDYGGREIKTHGDFGNSKVVVTSLSEAAKTHNDIVEKYLYELINRDSGKFEALNGALWNDGVFIYIPKGTTVEKPIHLMREAGQENSSVYHRLLIVVGENAEVTIVDEYGGGSTSLGNGTSNSNSAVEIFGLQDSRTRFVSLQRQGEASNSYMTHRARIERGATMLTIPMTFGGSLSKSNFGVILNGEGADSNMYGLAFGATRQHIDNHTLHHHAAGQTTSNIDIKVVLRDKALSAYTGLIRIDPDAKTCEAFQENRNLLLTPGCKAETIPELEILNEDVMCSHGATVGEIDPHQVFFLMCRGIEESEAIRMIVSGFVVSTLKEVPANLQKRIAARVARRLEDL